MSAPPPWGLVAGAPAIDAPVMAPPPKAPPPPLVVSSMPVSAPSRPFSGTAATAMDMGEFAGYSEDQQAKALLKRLVQATARAFYDDAMVAVMDVLVEPPFYLRDPDGRTDKSLREIEKADERAAALDKFSRGRKGNGNGNGGDGSKKKKGGAGNNNNNGEDDEEEEEEEVTDPTDLPMGLRMKLPLKYLRGLLHKLERDEKLVKSEFLGGARYFYIDYDFFYSVVAYRLRRMASLIGEREVALRGSTQYVCPLCRTSVSELEFKVPYCTACVESGENTPDQCPLEEVSNRTLTTGLAATRTKLAQQLSLADGAATQTHGAAQAFPRDVAMAAASSPVALLAHLKKLEAAGLPIYPIPLFDLRRHLENFQKRGVPRGGFGSNAPSNGAAGAAVAAKQQLEAQTGSAAARRRLGVDQGGGTFSAEHFQAAEGERERAAAAARARAATAGADADSLPPGGIKSSGLSLKRPRPDDNSDTIKADEGKIVAEASTTSANVLPDGSSATAAAAAVDATDEQEALALAEFRRQREAAKAEAAAAAAVDRVGAGVQVPATATTTASVAVATSEGTAERVGVNVADDFEEDEFEEG